jgi:hypothetical protein
VKRNKLTQYLQSYVKTLKSHAGQNTKPSNKIVFWYQNNNKYYLDPWGAGFDLTAQGDLKDKTDFPKQKLMFK